MKRTVKTIAYSFFSLVIFLIALIYAVLSSNLFQNWLTERVTVYLSAQFKTRITIGHIAYKPFSSFTLDRIYWGDQKNDTLFYVEKLQFNLGSFSMDSLQLSLNDVKVTKGYCKIITYPDSTFNIDLLTQIADTTPSDPNAPKFRLYFDKVTCTDSRFRFIDSLVPFEPEGFDGLNQDFRHIDLVADRFWIIKDSLSLDIRKLRCEERSGFRVNNITCKASIASSGMHFDRLDIQTPYSHISDHYSMLYDNWDELADYNNKVKMVATLRDAQVDMRDIAYFAPAFKAYQQRFRISGNMSGPTKNMKMKQVQLSFGRMSHFEGNISLKGLPSVEEMFIDMKADDALTNKADLEYLLGFSLPAELGRLGKMKFKGRYTGFYDDFVAFGHFNTGLGDVQTDLNMKLDGESSNASYSGNLELVDFDIGALADLRKYVGRTSLKAAVKGKGFALKDMNTSFHSDLRYIHANGYDYRNIEVKGLLNKKMFTGNLDMNDPHAQLAFNGTVDLRSRMARYNFDAKLRNADLRALKIDTSGNVFSTDVRIDFAFKDLDHNEGTIELNNLLFVKHDVQYPLKQITAVSKNLGNDRYFRMRSDIFDVEMKGNYVMADMGDNVNNILYTLLPNYFKPVTRPLASEDFTYRITVSNSDWISDVFYPNARVYDLEVEGNVSAARKDMTLNAVASTIVYKAFTVKDLAIKSGISGGETGRVLVGVDGIFENDTSVVKDLAMLSNITRNAASNHVKITDTSGLVQADILADMSFLPNEIRLVFQESSIFYRKKPFYIADSSLVIYNDSQVLCKDVKVTQGESYVLINGFYDLHDAHNLRADARQIDLSLVNLFFPKIAFQVGGTLNGAFVLKGNNHKNYLNTFVTLDDLSFDHDTIGDFSLTSNYNDKQQRFLVYAKSLNGKLTDFEAGGYVSTSGDEEMAINVNMEPTDVRSFQVFLKEQVYFYDGRIAGKCKITGKVSKPLINGELHLTDMDLRVEYLKTRYRMNTHMVFDNRSINIIPFSMVDEHRKAAMVSGSITHTNFSELRFNIEIDRLNHFMLLNTTAKDNTLFYGTAYASGRIKLTGTQGNLLLETDLTSERGTIIYIPLLDGMESGEAGFINFVDKDTTVKSFVAKKSTLSGFELSSVIHATPDAEIQLIMNEQTGDIIRGRGTGTVKLELTKQGAFNMYGQITVDEGEYRFTAANVFTKKFVLTRGGTIDWTGDPLQARMDIQGMYYVRKASIIELVPSATTGNSLDSKIPVECLLYVTGSITSPVIRFDLNFPDLQSTIGTNNVSEMQNVLRTLRAEPDMMNQQVMSLMLFGKFVPMSGYNISSASNVQSGAATTFSDILTARANNLVGSIIPGLDFNIDYQAGTETSRNRTIVSASKKFYNNRLEVQTSYDPQFATNANITTQYNLRKDGNLKMKAYNRNTTNPINSSSALTQGIGLYYRKEFDTFIDLFSKKQKQIQPLNK